MKTNTKRFLVAGLGTASLALWIPQLTGMLSADSTHIDAVLPAMPVDTTPAGANSLAESAGPAPRAELPPSAAGAPSSGGAPPTGAGAVAPMPGDPSSAGSITDTSRAVVPSMSELVTSLRESVETLKRTAGPSESARLEELATAWGRKHEAPPSSTTPDSRADSHTNPVVPTTATVNETRGNERSVNGDEAVNEFVEAQAVRMILISPEKRMARLGVNTVQEGDAFLGGRLVVRRIERTFVVLESDGREVRMDLRAYEPRATTHSEEGPVSNASSASSATPAATPAAIPAATATAPTPSAAPSTEPKRP